MNNMNKSRGSSRPQHQRRAGGAISAAAPRPSDIVPALPGDTVGIDDNACVVCFKNVDIYSIGDCDHPVCYECSTRMRVLCQQNECPICRHVLSKVLFTVEKLPYRELEASNRSDFYSKKYRIGFCTADIQQKFFELLDHPCPNCEAPPYRTFQALRNHVRREHNLLYCDLCVETLKIFTFERRCYTQAELHQHNTKGDLDNRSHRGHPLCEYCNQRYVDRDELFRHLRREHYFCHFCDADGCNEFYNDYADLAEHFRTEHYLCEEGKCATEQFVGAFRNEIEYKAHVASVHGKSLNKQQAKQTRTLQLEITLGPRGRNGQMEQGIANMRQRNDELPDYLEDLPHPSATIDAGNEEQFPLLGGVTAGPSVSLVRPPPPSMRNLSGTSGLARTKENFPALGGGGANVPINARAAQQARQPVAAVFKKPTKSSQGGASGRGNGAAGNGMVLHVSNRPAANGAKKATELDFPALSGKGKKPTRKDLEEDMGNVSNAGMGMSNVSAKHRTLCDDYVSVANPSNFQKLQMVQKEELEAKARLEALKKSAPKLTTVDFPSLGPSTSKAAAVVSKPSSTAAFGAKSSSTAAFGAKPSSIAAFGPKPTSSASLNWTKPVSEKKQRELENRKAKVAAAPVLPTTKASNNNNSTHFNPFKTGNNQEQQQQQQPSKKDKKPKEKKKENQENQPKANSNNKQKEKNNNNEQNPPISNANNCNGKSSTVRAPPGFNAGASAAAQMTPPPGFISNVTVNSVAKLPNNMTFTSSLGESYNIVPSSQTYSDPPDATARNQRLVDQFRDILRSPEALNEFRLLSQKFREGSCNGQAYYEHCQSALRSTFNKLFPELLVMLPDIGKQQELYLVHKQHVNSLTPAQRKSLPSLEVCGKCKQILLTNDFASHQEAHDLTANFPTLGNNGANVAAGNKNAQRK